jgi:hypothetical protein
LSFDQLDGVIHMPTDLRQRFFQKHRRILFETIS